MREQLVRDVYPWAVNPKSRGDSPFGLREAETGELGLGRIIPAEPGLQQRRPSLLGALDLIELFVDFAGAVKGASHPVPTLRQ